MDFDLKAAVTFVATHARILERRRLDLMLGDGTPENVIAALDAYRNPDGGYGWGLEPDLRSAISQPAAAMHALELLADIRDTKTDRPVEILDWLAGHTFDDGSVPFALAYTDTEGSAPALGRRRPVQAVAADDHPARRAGSPPRPAPRRHRRASVAGRCDAVLPDHHRPNPAGPARVRADVRDALPRRYRRP
jgi:hypothetical protein